LPGSAGSGDVQAEYSTLPSKSACVAYCGEGRSQQVPLYEVLVLLGRLLVGLLHAAESKPRSAAAQSQRSARSETTHGILRLVHRCSPFPSRQDQIVSDLSQRDLSTGDATNLQTRGCNHLRRTAFPNPVTRPVLALGAETWRRRGAGDHAATTSSLLDSRSCFFGWRPHGPGCSPIHL